VSLLSAHHHAQISLCAAFIRCDDERAAAVADERSTAMHTALNQGLWADQERTVAWVDRHGWRDAEVRWERRLKRRAAIARVLRALAAWFAPVEAASVPEHRQVTVGGGHDRRTEERTTQVNRSEVASPLPFFARDGGACPYPMCAAPTTGRHLRGTVAASVRVNRHGSCVPPPPVFAASSSSITR
jgi:hypothetical protein